MKTFPFSLVAPTRTLLKDNLLSLTVPTKDGLITILPGHTPLICEVVLGEVTAIGENTISHHLHVEGGTLHIAPEHAVVLLADSAEHHYEIDLQDAEDGKERAKKLLEQSQDLTNREVAFAKNLLEKNLQRINIARKHAHRRKGSITSEGVRED